MNDDLASREISPDLREFMNRLPGGTAIYELAGKSMIELYVNDSYYHMIGESRDQRHDYEGSGCLNATLNEDQHIVKKAIRELADGALHEDITFRINKKPDGFTWVRLLADAHHLSDGRVLIYCNYSNVDEQMRREIELSSSKILAEVCMRNTKTCEWEYYPDTRLAVFSDFAQKSLSLPRSVKDPYNSLINRGFIHPDSINEHHLLFSGEFPNKSQIRQSLKIRTADRKDWRWVESIMAPVDRKSVV